MESKHIGSPIFVSRNRVQDLSFLKEKVVGEGGRGEGCLSRVIGARRVSHCLGAYFNLCNDSKSIYKLYILIQRHHNHWVTPYKSLLLNHHLVKNF